jgi:IS30 family transposase
MRGYHRLKPIDIQHIIDLYKHGVSTYKIAQLMGRSVSTVHDVLVRNGIHEDRREKMKHSVVGGISNGIRWGE